MVAEHRLEEPLADDVGRVVVGHRQLFEDDAALGLELVGVEQRRGEHVGEHLDRHRQILVADLGVVAGVLLGGHRVVLAADRVERDGDVERRARRGALEEQVLEEVRRAVGDRLLVARADRDPEADGRALRSGHLLAQDAHAAGEHAAADETAAGCGDRQLGQVEGKLHRAVHRDEAYVTLSSPAWDRSHPNWGHEMRTNRQVCLSACGNVAFRRTADPSPAPFEPRNENPASRNNANHPSSAKPCSRDRSPGGHGAARKIARHPLTRERQRWTKTESVTSVSIEIARPGAALPSAPAKLRILETANELFYDDGIRTVGVDRLISASSVTKATFYKHYGSKDRLIAEYIGHRHRLAVEWLADIVDGTDDPARVIRAMQESILGSITGPGFRGCPFLNAAAEFPDAASPGPSRRREPPRVVPRRATSSCCAASATRCRATLPTI